MRPLEYLLDRLQTLQAEQAQEGYLFPEREDEKTIEKRVLINEYLRATDILRNTLALIPPQAKLEDSK